MSVKANAISVKAIRTASKIVDMILITVILFLIAVFAYALWDSNQVYSQADNSNYEIYKPTAENQGKTFQELQAINPEVFAWLTVYGTHVDYPLTHGQDNLKYLNTDAEGRYSLTGSIFLDYKNSESFTDFNNILYGHHMDKDKMFGDIGSFEDQSVFESHKYGNLYFDGKDHGIEFFTFDQCDGYDLSVFTANVTGEQRQQAYLDGLLNKAIFKRDIGVTIADRIVLLSTCSEVSTNGRDILVGVITDETYKDPFPAAEVIKNGQTPHGVDSQSGILEKIPRDQLVLFTLVILLAAAIIALSILDRRRRRRSRRNRDTKKTNGEVRAYEQIMGN